MLSVKRMDGGREYKESSNGNPCEIVNLLIHNLCVSNGMLPLFPWTFELHHFRKCLNFSSSQNIAFSFKSAKGKYQYFQEIKCLNGTNVQYFLKDLKEQIHTEFISLAILFYPVYE